MPASREPECPYRWQAGKKNTRNPLVFAGKVCLPRAKKWQEPGRQDKEPDDARGVGPWRPLAGPCQALRAMGHPLGTRGMNPREFSCTQSIPGASFPWTTAFTYVTVAQKIFFPCRQTRSRRCMARFPTCGQALPSRGKLFRFDGSLSHKRCPSKRGRCKSNRLLDRLSTIQPGE
jgi:hypothetical protein